MKEANETGEIIRITLLLVKELNLFLICANFSLNYYINHSKERKIKIKKLFKENFVKYFGFDSRNLF